MNLAHIVANEWLKEYAPDLPPVAREALYEAVQEMLDGVKATYEVQAMLLKEEIGTLRGEPKPYRVIERETGIVRDLESAQRVMDTLFAIGGLAGLQRFWVYKQGRRIAMPQGGDVDTVARWLERRP